MIEQFTTRGEAMRALGPEGLVRHLVRPQASSPLLRTRAKVQMPPPVLEHGSRSPLVARSSDRRVRRSRRA